MLKVDFHIHTGSDPKDKLDYSDKDLIDRAAELNFDAISITNHELCPFSKELENYAKERNILLIPGCEAKIHGKHVVVLNISQKDASKLKTFEDLRKLKKEKDVIIIAVHPFFFFRCCLGKELEKNIDIFDAIEYSFFHTKRINRNKKAMKIAEKYSKPMILTSDLHSLKRFGKSYSLIDAKKNFKDIKKAINNNKIKFESPPLKLSSLLFVVLRMFKEQFFKLKRCN